MKYCAFIQSLSSSETGAGELLYNRLHNRSSCEYKLFPPIKVKSLAEIRQTVDYISKKLNMTDHLILCIDAHSYTDTITFKNPESQDKNKWTEYKDWNSFNEMFDSLYDKFGENIVVIIVSCYSASFCSSMKSPHLFIIASDGEVNAMRAKEQLSVFYDEYCKECNVEKAYSIMTNKYPSDEEAKIEGSYKAVLKLFK